MNDIEILEKLKEKARHRELGIDSINYYYALAHALEQLKEGDKVYIRGNLEEFVAKD